MFSKASLFDRLLGKSSTSGYDPSDDEKRSAVNQGLLALSAGLLGTGGGFGNGLSAGIHGGLLSLNKGKQDSIDGAFKKQQLLANGNPSEFAALDLQAKAAGFEPGSEGYKRFFLVHGGLEARQSSAAIQYKPVVGKDGVTRYIAFDPNDVGAQAIGSGDSYGAPVGGPTPVPTPVAPMNPATPMMGNAFAKAVEQVESNGNPLAVSPAGALGRMQTMPSTLTDPGFGITPAADRSDAETTRVGQQYLDKMMQRYGDPRVALAAYNWGPTSVDKALVSHNGDVEAMLANAPSETKKYIPKVLAQLDKQGANPFESRPQEQQKALDAAAEAKAKLDVEQSGYGAASRQAADIEKAKADAIASAGIANAGKSGTTAATVAAATDQGKSASEAYSALQNKGMVARGDNTKLFQLRNALKNTYTGSGANQLLGLKKAAAAFGVESKGLGDAQLAASLSNQLALSMRNPAGGEGMPGAMSDADRSFLTQSVPSLENTPDGWKAMVDMKVALNDSAIKQAKYASELRRKGTPIQDIPELMQDYADEHPVFKRPAGEASANTSQKSDLAARLAKYGH